MRCGMLTTQICASYAAAPIVPFVECVSCGMYMSVSCERARVVVVNYTYGYFLSLCTSEHISMYNRCWRHRCGCLSSQYARQITDRSVYLSWCICYMSVLKFNGTARLLYMHRMNENDRALWPQNVHTFGLELHVHDWFVRC